jgi:hypothetical protein
MKPNQLCLYFSLLFILLPGLPNVYGQIMVPKGDITLGSSEGDYLIRTIKTSDGGYLLIGMVNTANTDVSGPIQGNYDYWVVKTNMNGQMQWNRLLGSTSNEFVADVTEDIVNGGFVIVGYTDALTASGHISSSTKGGVTDIWVIKLSGDGKSIIWEKRVGGDKEDYASSIVQLSSGNFLIAGYTNSTHSSGDLGSTPSRGNYDYRLIHLNSSGMVAWDRRIGGPSFEGTGQSGGAVTGIQTSDGGYLIAGRSFSTTGGDKAAGNIGTGTTSDIWIVKLNAARTKQWDVTLGGSDQDILASVIETSDGYVVGGTTVTDDPVRGYAKNKQYFITKLNTSGSVIWQKTYGGSAADELMSLKQSTDGGYWLGGWSLSVKEGDKSEPGFGSADLWLVKLFSDGSKDFDATFGGSSSDYLTDILETTDNGLLMAGFSASPVSGTKTSSNKGADDFWMVKVNGIVALPVDLLFFNAHVISDRTVSLSWSTASESNNASFTVERSTNGQTFTPILQVPGAGNSKEVRNYTSTDTDALNGVAYYRLKQTDYDGKVSYSKTISIQIIQQHSPDFVVFPNPTDGSQLIIEVNSLDIQAEGTISLTDMVGHTIFEKPVALHTSSRINLLEHAPALKKGIYIITVQNQAGINRRKVVVQ